MWFEKKEHFFLITFFEIADNIEVRPNYEQ